MAWDAGCGSGQLSVPLARCFDRVIATDASDEQLARATPHPRVEYVQAASEDSGLQDRSIDLAVVGQAAHWFDLDGYYSEVGRVAAPGAAVALISYGGTRISGDLDPIVETFRTVTLAPYWAPQRAHVEDGYRSLPFPFREVSTPSFEISVAWSLDQLLDYMRTWSALRGLDAHRGEELLADLRGELTPAWEAGLRTVNWPLSVRAAYI